MYGHISHKMWNIHILGYLNSVKKRKILTINIGVPMLFKSYSLFAPSQLILGSEGRNLRKGMYILCTTDFVSQLIISHLRLTGYIHPLDVGDCWFEKLTKYLSR